MLGDTTFGDGAVFIGARFGDGAVFLGARFGDGASFVGATFGDRTVFDGATFGDKAQFDDTTFGDGARFGPVMSAGSFAVPGMRLPNPDGVGVSAEAIDARRLRIPDGGILRISRARVDLTEAAFVQPTIISPGSSVTQEPRNRRRRPSTDRRPSIVSLERADVASLVLTDVRLEDCRFAGAHNLDRIQPGG